MKKVLTAIVLVFLALYACNDLDFSERIGARGSSADSVLAQAFENRQSNLQIKGEGEVLKVLSDDNVGSRHQGFVLKLGSDQTLLIAHNIDRAPIISASKTGDSVEFFGEYEWNSRGGVIHWTHHNPQGKHKHASGWLRHRKKTYE